MESNGWEPCIDLLLTVTKHDIGHRYQLPRTMTDFCYIVPGPVFFVLDSAVVCVIKTRSSHYKHGKMTLQAPSLNGILIQTRLSFSNAFSGGFAH